MAQTMRGVVLPGGDRVEIGRHPVPEAGPGQALVRMKASGLCGSDLKFIYHAHTGEGGSAYQGVIAGHEPAGEVVAVGPGVTEITVGDRVVVYHIAGCGACDECRKGFYIGCTGDRRAAYGWQRDGGHADFLLAEAVTLIPLPDQLSFVDGAMVACGVGTAYQSLARAGVSGRDRVLVVGLGPVGLAVTALAAAMGAEVFAADPVAERAALAVEAGAREAVHPDEMLARARGGFGCEVAIDCSGSEAGRRLCLETARVWGRVVLVGEGGEMRFEASPLVIRKQLAIYGSWVCGVAGMGEAIQFLTRHRLHPEAWVTHRFRLEEADEAYRTFAAGSTGKVVLVMD